MPTNPRSEPDQLVADVLGAAAEAWATAIVKIRAQISEEDEWLHTPAFEELERAVFETGFVNGALWARKNP